jgi:hypothetical protein
MHDSIHTPGDADAGIPELDDALLAADAADIHRLLAWYYGAHDPTRRHIRVRDYLEDEAA